MAKQKKPVHRVQMTEGKRNIIHQLLEEYDIQSAEDIQDALKDLLGGTIKEMMEAEMDDHLGRAIMTQRMRYFPSRPSGRHPLGRRSGARGISAFTSAAENTSRRTAVPTVCESALLRAAALRIGSA